MKKSYLQLALLAALAAPIHAIENMKRKPGDYDLVVSTAAEGTAIDGAGAILASATALPVWWVADSNCVTGSRNCVRPGDPGIVEVQLHSTAGTIAIGTQLQLHSNGTAKADLGTGSRVIIGMAYEAKQSDGQLLKARLYGTPIIY